MDRMTYNLLFHQLLTNPLPWTVDRDWAYEVRASNGAIIAKCKTPDEADAIIKAAEGIRKELDSVDVEALLANAD